MTIREKMIVRNVQISFQSFNNNDYISLTDIARYRDSERSDYIIQNWLRNRNTIELLGLWEKLNNPKFKSIEFDGLKQKAGLNSFSLTPRRWISVTRAIGILSRKGRGGGVYAHKDIAFEFASWLSAEFKLYLIKEFERLKNAEYQMQKQEWDTRRMITKANYRIHTDAIKSRLPQTLTQKQINFTYANEADVLNMALFGQTAAQWRERNKGKRGNVRDDSTIQQLVVLANIESYNAEMIRDGLDQPTRLLRLNTAAISQLKSLTNNNLNKLNNQRL